MSKIPTAEDFLQEHPQISHFYDDKTNQMVCFSADVQKALIEFAKRHCQAQQEAILENVKTKQKKKINQGSSGSEYHYSTIIDKNSIINAYPLDNIK